MLFVLHACFTCWRLGTINLMLCTMSSCFVFFFLFSSLRFLLRWNSFWIYMTAVHTISLRWHCSRNRWCCCAVFIKAASDRLMWVGDQICDSICLLCYYLPFSSYLHLIMRACVNLILSSSDTSCETINAVCGSCMTGRCIYWCVVNTFFHSGWCLSRVVVSCFLLVFCFVCLFCVWIGQTSGRTGTGRCTMHERRDWQTRQEAKGEVGREARTRNDSTDGRQDREMTRHDRTD